MLSLPLEVLLQVFSFSELPVKAWLALDQCCKVSFTVHRIRHVTGDDDSCMCGQVGLPAFQQVLNQVVLPFLCQVTAGLNIGLGGATPLAAFFEPVQNQIVPNGNYTISAVGLAGCAAGSVLAGGQDCTTGNGVGIGTAGEAPYPYRRKSGIPVHCILLSS